SKAARARAAASVSAEGSSPRASLSRRASRDVGLDSVALASLSAAKTAPTRSRRCPSLRACRASGCIRRLASAHAARMAFRSASCERPNRSNACARLRILASNAARWASNASGEVSASLRALTQAAPLALAPARIRAPDAESAAEASPAAGRGPTREEEDAAGRGPTREEDAAGRGPTREPAGEDPTSDAGRGPTREADDGSGPTREAAPEAEGPFASSPIPAARARAVGRTASVRSIWQAQRR